MRNKRLLLAWWSNTGGTAALVDAAAQGAEQAVRDLGPTDSHLSILSVRCDRLSAQALQRADGLILATPECLGTVAGPMKSWIDRCYYPALEALAGRPYAAIVCAGSDGDGALRLIGRVAAGWRLREVAPALKVITGAQTPEAIAAPKVIKPAQLEEARQRGATLAAGLLMGLW
jgi:hypothetical protein